MTTSVLALAGGVGGAKLALGLADILPPDDLTIVVNTGDDDTFHGLHISPDLDTLMYTLCGLANPDTGWGIAGDTFTALAMLQRYGAPAWFNLGDRDLATHVRRTDLLAQGRTLSQVTKELCQALGVAHQIVPMSDQPVRTIAVTDVGDLSFQEYFVHRQCQPTLRAVRFHGADQAQMSPGFKQALRRAKALVFCPSNPVISIGPILAVPGVREAITGFGGPRVAVSPIVGGQALRGPAAKMLRELGEESSCVAVARRYLDLCDLFVIDDADRPRASEIEALGMRVAVTNTVMRTRDDKRALARTVLALAEKHERRD